MPDFSGEKSQEATPHRRQQAREEGQIAKSQDLTSAVLLVTALAGMLFLGQGIYEYFCNYTQRQLSVPPPLAFSPTDAVQVWTQMVLEVGRHVGPLLGLMLLIAVVAELAQVGFLFLPGRLTPDISRLNPLQGLGRLFSLTNASRLFFGLFKIAVISAVAWVALRREQNTILGLAEKDLLEIATYLTGLLLWTALKMAAALLVLALLDYGFQWWKQEQDLRMTPQEVREEMKNLEGDPQVASRRKAVQKQLAMNRLGESVPKADVVVTNPTELAIAIQYEPATMAAPIVVAKGAGLLAKRIRELALQHGIPIVERKPLARALYREVAVNRPIPPDRYAAVAEILAYVYQLTGKKIPGQPG